MLYQISTPGLQACTGAGSFLSFNLGNSIEEKEKEDHYLLGL